MFDNPLTLQERFETSFMGGGARSKRASHAHASLILVGGEILKKGVDQPFSHFIIPFYQGLFVETFYIKAPVERDSTLLIDRIFFIQILIACLTIERCF